MMRNGQEQRGGNLPLDGAYWRRMAAMGARSFPRWWMRYSPPVIGLAAAVLMPTARRAVRKNLERIRGPAPLRQDMLETARTFATFASCLSETLAQGSKNATPIEATFVGAQNIYDAMAKDKGLLLLTMHTAGWEIATPLLAHNARYPKLADLDVMIVMEQERDALAQAIHDQARASYRAKLVRVSQRDALSALPILRHLENKGSVAMQIDRPPPSGRTLPVQLCGLPYAIPEGPLRIAQLSGAPILPVFSARLGHHKYYLRTFRALEVPRRPVGDEVAHAAQAIADAMGEFLQLFPTQWFQFDA